MAWTEKYLDLSLGSGGSGTSGDPWGSYAAAVTGLGTPITVPTMVRVKGSGSLSGGTTINNVGTATAPLWWRGCNASFVGIADADTATTRPALDCSTFLLTLSGAFHIFSHLSFSGSQTASSSGQVLYSGASGLLYRCRFRSTAANANGRAIQISGTETRAVGCWIKSTTTGVYSLGLVGNRSAAYGCSVEGGVTAINVANTCNICFCTARDTADDGISIAGVGVLSLGNSIRNVGRDGIRTTQPTTVLINNIVSGAGGYGYNYTGTASIAPLFIANSYYNCTSGGFASGITEDFRLYNPGTAGLLAGEPFVGSTDLSLTANGKALGFPGYFEGETFVGYMDLGAVQREEPVGGGGSSIYRRRSRVMGV